MVHLLGSKPTPSPPLCTPRVGSSTCRLPCLLAVEKSRFVPHLPLNLLFRWPEGKRGRMKQNFLKIILGIKCLQHMIITSLPHVRTSPLQVCSPDVALNKSPESYGTHSSVSLRCVPVTVPVADLSTRAGICSSLRIRRNTI